MAKHRGSTRLLPLMQKAMRISAVVLLAACMAQAQKYMATATTLEEGEAEIPPESQDWVYIAEVALVIVLSLSFEAGQEAVKEHLEETGRSDLNSMIDVVFKEITILGFIGLLVYILTKTGGAATVAGFILGPDGTAESLQESFESIHMILFAVMIIFCIQCAVCVSKANEITETWRGYEEMKVRGKTGSIAARLREEGYLDSQNNTLKPLYFERDPVKRFFQKDDASDLVQWRTIRHIFMLPGGYNAPGGLAGDGTVKVPEPSLFDFANYLQRMLTENLEQIVEVDTGTWIVACILSPLIVIVLSVEEYYRPTLILFGGLFLTYLWFQLTMCVYSIYLKSFPDIKAYPLLNDPSKVLQLFHLEQKIAKGEKPNFVEVESPTQNGIGALENNLSAPLLQGAYPVVERAQGQQQSNSSKSGSKTSEEISSDIPDELKAWFRTNFPTIHQLRRPWWLKYFSSSELLPHSQQLIFPLREAGPFYMAWALESMMFFTAIFFSGMIVSFLNGWSTWDFYNWIIFFASLAGPMWVLNVVLPRCISKYTIITSIEHFKNKTCISEVIQDAKKDKLKDVIQLLQIVKLKGKMEHYDQGGSLSEEDFAFFKQKWEDMPEGRTEQIMGIFKEFDETGDGLIDAGEMINILTCLGFGHDSDVKSSATTLMKLVNRSATPDSDDLSNIELDLEEFQVLMALALNKPSPEEAKEDARHLFEWFDSDGGGEITVEEFIHKLMTLGCPMTKQDVIAFLFECFGIYMPSLNVDQFVEWMTYMEEHMDEEQESHE